LSSLFEKLQRGTGTNDSTTSTVKQFLDAEGYETKTRINDPDGMTFYDLTELYCADPKEQRKLIGIQGNRPTTDADYLGYFGKRKRINEISREGKSRGEGVQVALGAQVQEERKTREKVLEGIGLR
jgi:hypothetical protein